MFCSIIDDKDIFDRAVEEMNREEYHYHSESDVEHSEKVMEDKWEMVISST